MGDPLAVPVNPILKVHSSSQALGEERPQGDGNGEGIDPESSI